MAGCAMPTTLPSSWAIALPSTVAVSTHFPRPVERCRPSAPVMAATGSGAGSVTPRDIAEVAGGFGMAAVCGDTRAAVGDRGVDAVPGHHHGVLGEGEQLRGDALDERLEITFGGRLARPAIEEGVAGDDGVADTKRDASDGVPWGVEDGDARGADLDFGAVIEAAVDPCLGDLDFDGAHEDRGAR